MTRRRVRMCRPVARSPLTLVVILLTLLGCSDRFIAPSPAAQPAALAPRSDVALGQVCVIEVRAAIQACVINGLDPARGLLTYAEQAELQALYERRGHLPLWLDTAGRPDRSADEALTLLRGAADEGLDPADYRQDQIDRLTATLQSESPLSIRDLANFDVALSAGVLRYFHHVHQGRVEPSTIGLRLSAPADHHDFAALLRSAIAELRIAETVGGSEARARAVRRPPHNADSLSVARRRSDTERDPPVRRRRASRGAVPGT